MMFNVFRALLGKIRGYNNFCPICGKYSKSFLPAGAKPRKNALCPNCHSLERHRLAYLYMEDKNISNKKVLHFAPEECLRNKIMSEIKDYVTADLMMKGVDLKTDITKIKAKAGSFDLVICIHVLEHIEKDVKAMKEIHRVLTKDGLALIMVPVLRARTYEDFSIKKPADRLREFGQEDHVRIYGVDIKNRLKRSGFKVNEIDYAKKLNPFLLKFYSVMSDDVYSGLIYECKK